MKQTIDEFLRQWNDTSLTVPLHTSGSTGTPKQFLAEKSKMLASARITCDFLQLKPGDKALLCLPIDYIAGKMMVVRSIERQLHLAEVEPSNHPLAEIDENFDLVAMVPSQVYTSLQDPIECKRLKRIRHLIIGGGAISRELETTLRSFPNAIWSTYGMTETLSHIALRRINGDQASEWYTPFDGVDLSLEDMDNNNPFVGRLVINAPHVCEKKLVTNDIVEFHKQLTFPQQFRVIGRTDNVICSGGIKLHIEQLEEALRPFLHVPFCITKRPDKQYGEVAILLLGTDEVSSGDVLEVCRRKLTPYAVPKAVYTTQAGIPLTPNGKIDRRKALEIIRHLP